MYPWFRVSGLQPTRFDRGPRSRTDSPTGGGAGTPTAFERDLLALKAKGLHPKALFAASSALRAKHGLSPNPVQVSALNAAIPEPVDLSRGESMPDTSIARRSKAAASVLFEVLYGQERAHPLLFRPLPE